MTSQPFDLVIFDLDDTLVEFRRAARLAALAQCTGLPEAHIHDAMWGSDFERAAERDARATGDDYLAAFNARIGARLTRAQWIAARAAGMHVRPRMLELLAAVRARTAVALLTNNGALLREALPELVPDICALIPDRLHASHEFGARKPEPEVFARLLARHGVAPARALFIDDDAEYITGAAAAGLAALRYVGDAQVRAELVRRGVIE
jgi:putative hydrolase of the HAD superfamily